MLAARLRQELRELWKKKKEENTEFWVEVEVTVKGGFLLALLLRRESEESMNLTVLNSLRNGVSAAALRSIVFRCRLLKHHF